MCLSYVGKLAYGFLMVVILATTAFAFFTPGWRHFSTQDTDDTGNVGLANGCSFPFNSDKTCTQWWDNRPKWEKLVKGLFLAAMALEIGALGWVGLSYLLCCMHRRFMHALPVWSILITVFLGVGIAIFFARYKHDAGLITDGTQYTDLKTGYSATVMSGACGLAFISIFLAAGTSFFADRTCC